MNHLPKITFFLLPVLLLAFGSCCRGVACHDDVVVLEKIKQLFPFVVSDQVKYLSNNNDTLDFICSAREFVYSIGYEVEDVPQACCDGYNIENLNIFLENTVGGDTIRISTSDYSFSGSLFCKINIGDSTIYGKWPGQFDGDPYLDQMDSIQLVGKSFYNVYQANNGVKIYLQPDSLGIVGFIIDGKEWRIL